MSKAQRLRHRMKTVAREWSAWTEIKITDEIRQSAPHMRHVHRIFYNSRFQVDMFEVKSEVGGIVQCCINRHGQIELATWPEIQRVKTELFGPDHFAIEIYPDEVVEFTMQTRIIWVMPAGWRPPCGLHLRTAWGGDGK